MSNIYIVTYGWEEDDSEGFIDQPGEPDDIIGRHRLITNSGNACFPYAMVNVFKDKTYESLVYDMSDERCYEPFGEMSFSSLDEAKQFCEYKILGGEPPPSIKIEQVEEKLDRGN